MFNYFKEKSRLKVMDVLKKISADPNIDQTTKQIIPQLQLLSSPKNYTANKKVISFCLKKFILKGVMDDECLERIKEANRKRKEYKK